MTLSNIMVQVARPIAENSLALGVVGTALLMWASDDRGIPDMYVLDPESPGDKETVSGLLFTDGELEALL